MHIPSAKATNHLTQINMHPPTILSLFTLATTAHMIPPQPPHPHILPRSSTEPTSSCTFTLWHKQISPSSPSSQKTNYIYLPTITSSATNLIFNVAGSRPAQAHNSYSRLSATQQFAVRGLPGGGQALTISGRDGEDELVFETDEEEGVRWVVGGSKVRRDGSVEMMEKGCWVGEWVESGLNRERKLECVFPCKEMVGEEDEDNVERVELR